MQKFLSIVALASLISGCASIMSGRLQDVSVNTVPANHASCMLSNDKGEWYVDSAPATLQINSSYQDLKVSCEKEGYYSADKEVVSSTKGWMFANIVFGGGVGLILDGLNGAGFAYPKQIDVEMKADEHLILEGDHHEDMIQ